MIYGIYKFSQIGMENMSDRLRQARIGAGIDTASEASRQFGWTKSTYIAHENGQNDFDTEQAAIYGKAFKVAPEWLLLGVEPVSKATPGIDKQLLELDPAASKALIDRFNAMIEGVRLTRKVG